MVESKKQQPKRAFIYCRTSNDSEDKVQEGGKYSIDDQEEHSRELAERMGYEVIEVFPERNRKSWSYPTGWDYSRDVDVNQMLKDITNIAKDAHTRDKLAAMMSRLNEVQAVIVRNPDRLVRSIGYSDIHLQLMRKFREHGVLILSPECSPIDPSDSNATNLHFGVVAAIKGDDLQRKRIATRDGLRRARDLGRPWYCPTFYGFVRDADQKVIHEPDECKIIHAIFEDFVEAKPINTIVRELNLKRTPPPMRHCGFTDKEKTKRRKGAWEHSMILSILKRPQYAGFQYKAGENKKEWWQRETVKTVLYQPPVISKQLFEQAQKKLDQNRANMKSTGCKNPHSLSGMLVCAHCSKKLYITSTNKKRNKKIFKLNYYRCVSDEKTGRAPKCANVSVRENLPVGLSNDDAALYATGIEDCLLPLLYKGYITYLTRKKERPELQDEIDECERRLKIANHELTTLVTDLIDGKKTQDYVDKLRPQLEARCQELTQKQAALKTEAETLDNAVIPSMSFQDYPGRDIPVEIKRQLFDKVISQVVVAQDHIEVRMKHDGKFKLERIKNESGSWDLPKWTLSPFSRDWFEVREDGVHLFKRKRITSDTQFSITYQYDSYDPFRKLYENDNLIIWSVGVRQK